MYMQESVADKKKRPNFMMREDQTTKYIPLDVVERILSKLPTKAVLRFSAVSKPWNATIHTPRFGRVLHRNTACDNDDQLFIWPSSLSGIYYLGRFKGFDFDIISFLQSPLERTNPRPLCSCDGLFLIYDAARKICALWNPITRSKMCFAYPETTMNSPDQTIHGICYDPLEDDYKVVFVNVKSLLYTVFSCRNNSWTEPIQFPYKDIYRDPGVSVRGIPYWVVLPDMRKEEETRLKIMKQRYMRVNYIPRENIDEEIVYFDARDCGFKKFHKPAKAIASDSILLTSLNGRLCLCEDPTRTIGKDVWLLERDHSAWTSLAIRPCHRESDIVQMEVRDGGANSLFVAGPLPSVLYFERNYLPSGCAWYCHNIPSQAYAVQGSLVILHTAQESGIIIDAS